MKTYIVKFAYSGSSKREFFDKEFTENELINIEKQIQDYVNYQNKGEAKSDRIRYWSKQLKTK